MHNIIKKSFYYGNNKITLETGEIAKKSFSILARMDDTVIVSNLVISNEILKKNFLPLTVNYYERMYSIGKIPNNYFKREIKQSENEIIISRLIDRSIRPLILNNFKHEIQITITVLSVDNNVFTDIISIIAASALLKISNVPFNGPIFSCRVGFVNNNFIINPSFNDLINSDIDLVLSTTNKSILMIELFSKLVSKEKVLNSIEFGLKYKKEILNNINDFCNSCNLLNNKFNNFILEKSPSFKIIKYIYNEHIYKICSILDKEIKNIKLKKFKLNLINKLNKFFKIDDFDELNNILNTLEKENIKKVIYKNNLRLDNRLFNEIRNINSKISVLPRTHGSSIFSRGDTQALVTVTLGGEKDFQLSDNLFSNNNLNSDRFLFHYNFPPYATGEIGKLGFIKRREIGHGRLAKKSILPIIPNFEDFPYSIRIVSEIMESNGSSSMASVCGASLALMNAGVPIKKHIAGVAMGLINVYGNNIILSDISGEEDFIGDIDFKISGDEYCITSLQLDVKSNYININLIKKLLLESENSRSKILKSMYKVIEKHNSNLSKFSPKIYNFKIDKSKIKDIIGKGGKIIKNIINISNVSIDINDDGLIKIMSSNQNSIEIALNKIKEITNNIVINNIYSSKIIKILDIGIMVNIKNKKGLINLKDLDKNNNKKYKNFYIGQNLIVKVKKIDKNGKIYLTLNNN